LAEPGRAHAPGEVDQNVWTIQGEPNTEVIISRPSTVELTCATVVNRIPDLIAAAPGFITTDKMPTNAFRAKDLRFYVEQSPRE
jgi:4-hydroxy-tetrahydrodipicolinate reductase